MQVAAKVGNPITLKALEISAANPEYNIQSIIIKLYFTIGLPVNTLLHAS